MLTKTEVSEALVAAMGAPVTVAAFAAETTAETMTVAQVREFRLEAIEAGDYVQQSECEEAIEVGATGAAWRSVARRIAWAEGVQAQS